MAPGRGRDDRPSAALAGLVGTLLAGAGRQGASAAGPAGARFIGRAVSMQAALLAHGVPEATARELVAAARRDGRSEVRCTLPASGAHGAGCTLIVRRMRGNHAEAWALPLAGGPGEAPA